MFRSEVKSLHKEIAVLALEQVYKHLDGYFGEGAKKAKEKANKAHGHRHEHCCGSSGLAKSQEHCCSHEAEEGHSHKAEGHCHEGHSHKAEGHSHEGHSHEAEGHSHEHDPNEEYTGITTHDESIVGSVRRFYNGTYADAVEYLKGKVKAVAEKVGEAGGIIGHIKANVKSSGDFTMLSVTDDESESSMRDYPSERSTMELASIVFLVTEDKLLEILKSEFGE
ncbi:MAG: hypothetical protein LBC69_04015 [Eubacteriaceae bacterium]|nr:hypothetical protein [Eubacteriaceae bacterium]